MSSTHDLWKEIIRHCLNGDTGSYFLASDENKSGQVVLENGQLVTIAYGGAFAQEAIDKLKILPSLRFSFTPELVFPSALKLSANESAILLDSLGLEETAKETLQELAAESGPAVSAASSTPEDEYIEITYRGQKIRKLKSQANSNETTKKPKAKLIYRGNVVDQ